jgi:hypothetical protein
MYDWESEAKLLLRAELARRGVSYKALVQKLGLLDVVETEGAISNKINRGKFSMTFFLQCMKAIGVDMVSVAVEEKASETDSISLV